MHNMTDGPHSGMLRRLTRSPVGGGLLWVLFAILFYSAGLAFTTWLLQPEDFAGGAHWILVALFPILVPGFFIVHRAIGCTGGRCTHARWEEPASGDPQRDHARRVSYQERPPG